MTTLQAFILGIVQGVTEFLPISSSAHLVLVPYVFGWSIPAEQIFPFNVLVQLGTLVSVIIYFWKDLITIIRDFIGGIFMPQPFTNEKTRLGWMLVLATLPAVICGVVFKDLVESVFHSATVVAVFLAVTAVLLFVAEQLGRNSKSMLEINGKNAFVIGLFQAMALFPGISRSGATISGGLLQGLKRAEAARFSFLMSIPVMIGAGLMSVPDLMDVPDLSSFLPVLLVGFVVSAVVGYLSIHWLLRFLTRRPLTVFSVYCLLVSAAILLLNSLS